MVVLTEEELGIVKSGMTGMTAEAKNDIKRILDKLAPSLHMGVPELTVELKKDFVALMKGMVKDETFDKAKDAYLSQGDADGFWRYFIARWKAKKMELYQKHPTEFVGILLGVGDGIRKANKAGNPEIVYEYAAYAARIENGQVEEKRILIGEHRTQSKVVVSDLKPGMEVKFTAGLFKQSDVTNECGKFWRVDFLSKPVSTGNVLKMSEVSKEIKRTYHPIDSDQVLALLAKRVNPYVTYGVITGEPTRKVSLKSRKDGYPWGQMRIVSLEDCSNTKLGLEAMMNPWLINYSDGTPGMMVFTIKPPKDKDKMRRVYEANAHCFVPDIISFPMEPFNFDSELLKAKQSKGGDNTVVADGMFEDGDGVDSSEPESQLAPPPEVQMPSAVPSVSAPPPKPTTPTAKGQENPEDFVF